MLSTLTPQAAAIYVRWSTEEQGSGTTLEEQKQTCLNFLVERGWPVRRDLLFIDDGYSAASLERPAIQRLRQAVRSGAVDAVVVYKLDRLTRNIVDAVELVLKEWEGRCALVSVTQSSIDTTNPLGRQFFTLMASFAEFERELIKDRTLSGKRRRALQGRNPGFRPPYGYRIGETPGSIIVDEERAPVVRRIFEMFSSGMSTMAIARRFNAEKIPVPGESKGWIHETLRYMLRNPMYVGRLEYGKSSKVSPQRRAILGKAKLKHRVPRHAVVQEAVPAIVPLDLWQFAQQLMAQRAVGSRFNRRAASSQYLLTGLLRCRCGHAMAGHETREGIHYYRCSSPPGTCSGTIVRTEVLDQAVVEAIRHQLRDRIGHQVMEAAAARAKAFRGDLEAQVASLRGSLAEIGRKQKRARQDYFASELNARMYSEFMAQLDEQEGEAKGALREAEDALANLKAVKADSAWLSANVEEVMSDTWSSLDVGQKKHILRMLVPKLSAYREKGSSSVHLDFSLATDE